MKEVIKMKDPQGLPNFIAAVLRMEKSAFYKVVSKVGHEEVAVTTKSNNTYRGARSNTGGRVCDRQRTDTGGNKVNEVYHQSVQRPRVKYTDLS